MATIINPKVINWQYSGQDKGGTALDATKFVGWTLDVNGTGTVSVPAAYRGAANDYTFDITKLGLASNQDLTIDLRAIFKDAAGNPVSSDPSNSAVVRFSPVPSAPLAFGAV